LLQSANNNITFEQIQLINIDAWYLDIILLITGTNNTISGVVSTGCNAYGALLSVQDASGSGGNGSTVIANASFSNFAAQAVNVYNSSIAIKNSNFSSGNATALFAQYSNIDMAHNSFSNSSGPAMNVYESDTVITDMVFDGMTWFNGSGAAMVVTNDDGVSSLNLTKCNFTNSFIPNTSTNG